MAGTSLGGILASKTNKERYGEDFYSNIGKMGGSAPKTKPCGFACDRERARLAGAKGGRISSRAGIKNGEGATKRRVIPVEFIN